MKTLLRIDERGELADAIAARSKLFHSVDAKRHKVDEGDNDRTSRWTKQVPMGNGRESPRTNSLFSLFRSGFSIVTGNSLGFASAIRFSSRLSKR